MTAHTLWSGYDDAFAIVPTRTDAPARITKRTHTMRLAVSAYLAVSFVFYGLACPLHAADPPTVADDALEVIESTRGGRHWVDAATADPMEAQDSLGSFEIAQSLRLELFAAEPLVMDPVAITFDPQGRMFVVEYGDYPTGPPEGEPPLSRVVLIEDTDDDGRADQRTVFADGLNFCHSAMPYRGGLLIGEQTRIVHLVDTDGDDIADVRNVLFDGFTPAHPQMQIGNPRWGIDNWVHCNYGPGKIVSSASPDEAVEMPRRDFLFDPRTLRFRADGGWGQFGNTVDRWGNRFYCTNRNPIITTTLTPEIAARNPFHLVSRMSYDVAPSGGDSRVYPLIEMKSNYLSHAGTHTAACGVTALTGDALGKDTSDRPYQDSVFVCEPIGHLVTRSVIDREGSMLTASRAQRRVDFLASTDPWFRPASLASGPDGALYLADMYRLWVEHPKFLPPEIAAKLDWRAGEDRGRVYRIVAKDVSPPAPYVEPRTVAERVAMLSDPNGWRQFIAQQLIVEDYAASGSSREMVVALRQQLRLSQSSSGRLHCLWTLAGIHALEDQDLIAALGDSDWHVRAAAAQLSSDRLDNEALLDTLIGHVGDTDDSVVRQAVISLGGTTSEGATAALANAAKQHFNDSLIRDAILTTAAMRSTKLLKACVADAEFVSSATDDRLSFVHDLAAITGARGETNEIRDFVRSFFGDPAPLQAWWQYAAVVGFADGLQRHRGPMGRTTLAAFVKSPPSELAAVAGVLADWIRDGESVLSDPDASLESRVAAIGLLSQRGEAESLPIWRELFRADQPSEIQVAAVRSFSRVVSTAKCQLLIEHWSQLAPAARPIAMDTMLRRTDGTLSMLEAMKDKTMSPSLLSIDQRVRLLKHSDASIRSLASELLGGAVSANRRAVAGQYQSALTADASPQHGAAVFQRACANCHRLRDVGHEIGPDLTDAVNRSPEALLYDILDPNAKVEPRYTSYSILTDRGEVYSGLIVNDSGGNVVLKMAENKVVSVSRDEIEEIKSNDISLMPEGIEKEVTPQQMADLLAYLRQR
ncbi:PVC-type heme-binding CxxCH protein [Stieleria varia]|uniref:Cytochrome c n=1 Tax=Stieleria varia TaxID=2528005 RepID=A0A5C6B3K0_9BACT|nr:PVC-type heme-binding CxxCH protein [Stieleria varia]TWU06112.1 Cytochrome c [Stieleria varia]